MPSNRRQVATLLQRQQKLWQQLTDESRSQIGRPPDRRGKPLPAKSKFLRSPETISSRDYESVPRAAEFSLDGRKTEVIVAQMLYEPLTKSDLIEAASALRDAAAKVLDKLENGSIAFS